MNYTYDGPKGPTRRAYIDEPGWSPPPPRPEPLPERCRIPLKFEPGRPYGPTPLRPHVEDEPLPVPVP